MKNVITIYKKSLPVQTSNPIELICDYLNGFEISNYTEYEDYYKICVFPTLYDYCEDITKGLNYLSISKEDIGNYCKISNNMALCLSENWLPYALSFLMSKDGSNRSMNIIHIDDHQDMMQPFIKYESNHFYDMISGKEVNFDDYRSLKSAVQSGAITIGSMLTSICYSLTSSNIIHIKKDASESEYGIIKKNILDPTLNNGSNRIAICPSSFSNSVDSYYVTSRWNNVIKKIRYNTPSILHIDMDFFNNRYNASTDWNTYTNRNDPDLIAQKKEMDQLINCLKDISNISKIKFVLIGLSPSFYPVEYWEEGLNYLLNELYKIGIGEGTAIIKK